MHEKLRTVFAGVGPLEEAAWNKVWPLFTLEHVPSRTQLTTFGRVENKLYFVIDGIIRLYCIGTNYNEVTVFLFAENHFASCYQSFLTQEPSDQALETLEDCTLLSVTKNDFDRLHQTVPSINSLTRSIAEQRFINAQRIFSSHISRTPEQRYLDFERDHGDLILRIPLHIIASFLGITPVSLSRIRKRTAKK